MRVSSPEVAEACKILENIYRAVNIALVNELKVIFERMGINVWEVIEAAKTKPFGFQAFYPGPGTGGPCIPKDPLYLAWAARRHDVATRFIDLADKVNLLMPDFVVGKIADALNQGKLPVNGSKVAILGMAYKRDVDDWRDSPGFAIVDRLLQRGATVSYHDPHVPRVPVMSRFPRVPALESQALTAEYLQEQDCVVIVTDHSCYDWSWVVAHSALVVDTRNATREVKAYRERVVLA